MKIRIVPSRVNPVSFPGPHRSEAVPLSPVPSGAAPSHFRGGRPGASRSGWRAGLALVLALLAAGSASASVWELGLRAAMIGQQRPQADLVVTMFALQQNVPVGGQIEYRIAVTNQGPDLATGVIVTDLLPVGLEYVSANTTQGSATISERTVLVNVGSLVVGQTVVINLIVVATQAGAFLNGVSLRTDTPDPNLENNTASYPASAGPQPPPPPQPGPPPPPGPPCAIDQSRAVLVIRGALTYNPATRRYLQQVMLGNLSRTPITGPVWLVLDDLSPIVLTNASGVTRCRAPLGSPYILYNVGADNVLRPQEVVSMTLSFAIPPNRGLRYKTRVLTGTAER